MSKRKRNHPARDQLDKPISCIKPSYREHYNADGSPKKSYTNYEAAMHAKMHIYQRLHEVVQPYRCSICGRYHIGHSQRLLLTEEQELLRREIKAESGIINNLIIEHQALTARAARLQQKLEELQINISLHYSELKYLFNNETITPVHLRTQNLRDQPADCQ